MASLVEYRNCPNCGKNDFDVLFDSNRDSKDFNVPFIYNMEEPDFQEGMEGYLVPGGKYDRHVKCKNCHLVYVNLIEKVSKINEYYSKARNAHASTIAESYLRTGKSQVHLIKKYGCGTSLLDVGCAQGFFLFEALKAGYITKGVELCREAAEYAVKEFGLEVEVGRFEEMQYPGDYFDVVTLWQVLEHLPQPLTVLKEVHRVLKPGGLIVVSMPNIGGIPAKILRRKWWDIKRLHINQFTPETLTEILRNGGFKNVSPVSYRGFVSLSILVTMILKYLKVYERLRALSAPESILGKVMNKIMLVYSSRLNHIVAIGFK